MTRRRLVITCVWLVGLFVSLATIEYYVRFPVADGHHVLVQAERLECMRPIAIYYAVYLTGMLGVWFVTPFPQAKKDTPTVLAFRLGLVLTLAVNLVVVYFVSLKVFQPIGPPSVYEDVVQGVTLAGYLSFLVVPVNYYFFGLKKPEG